MGSYQQLPQPNANYGQQWRPPQYNPNAGQKPTDYGQQIGASGDPSLAYMPDLNTNDPNRLYKNAANVSYDLGAGIDASTYQQSQQQGQKYDEYGNLMDQSFGQLAQTPGYTDEEAGNITRSGQYGGLATTPEQYASLDPTGAESAGMTGDPGAYGKYFNPQTITDANTAAANQVRNGVDRSEANIDRAVGNQYAVNDQALDPTKLSVSGAYGQQQGDVLTTTAGRLSSATGNPGLKTTAEYERQAGMTDAEVQQQAEAGARDVGLRYQTQMNDAAQRAAAGGNTSALAVGAQQARLAQQSATGAADARTNAELAARAAQRGAATGVQQTQLGAAQYKTGADLESAKYEGNLAETAVQGMEDTRLRAEQYKAGATIQAGDSAARNAIQGAESVGGLRTGAEANIGANNVAGQQWNQQTGTGITMSQDQIAADRAAKLYGVRQGNTQYGQQSTYQQGMGINNAQSQKAQTVADARIAGQGQYRNWATGQQGQALAGQQTATGQRINNYGTMSGALEKNANDQANYKTSQSQNSFGGILKRGLASGIAGALTSPSTYAKSTYD